MKTQKRIFILFALSLVFFSALFAQEKFDLRETTKHHEISVGVADLFSKQEAVYNYPFYMYDMAMPYYPYYYYETERSPKLALKYKYNFGKIALRTGFDFAYQDRDYDFDGNELDNNYVEMYGNFRLGVEFHSNFRRVQLCYGLDLFYVMSDYVSEYESNYTYYDENGNLVSKIVTNKSESSNTEYGISPFLGINYFINENLSIGVETNYAIGSYKNESKNTNGDETYKYWNKGINSRFGPIGILSLNVHF